MSGLINFIKGLFSGIFSIFTPKKQKESGSDAAKAQPKPQPKKNKKSSNGFYLELDEAKGGSSPTAAPSQPAAPVAAATTEKPSDKKPAAKSAEKKPSKRAAKLAAAKAEAGTAKPAEPVKAPEPVGAKTLNLPQPTVTNFATDYLLQTGTNGRRRPGANMASYLDMARQVKAPSRG